MVNRIGEKLYFTTETQRTLSLSESLHRMLCASESLWFYDFFNGSSQLFTLHSYLNQSPSMVPSEKGVLCSAMCFAIM